METTERSATRHLHWALGALMLALLLAALDQTIVSTALPTINQAVIIDGLSEPDYVAGTPVVRIDGAAAGFSGISIGAGGGGSTIQGLMITGFTVDGINVASGANNVTIADNWIGRMPPRFLDGE